MTKISLRNCIRSIVRWVPGWDMTTKLNDMSSWGIMNFLDFCYLVATIAYIFSFVVSFSQIMHWQIWYFLISIHVYSWMLLRSICVMIFRMSWIEYTDFKFELVFNHLNLTLWWWTALKYFLFHYFALCRFIGGKFAHGRWYVRCHVLLT